MNFSGRSYGAKVIEYACLTSHAFCAYRSMFNPHGSVSRLIMGRDGFWTFRNFSRECSVCNFYAKFKALLWKLLRKFVKTSFIRTATAPRRLKWQKLRIDLFDIYVLFLDYVCINVASLIALKRWKLLLLLNSREIFTESYIQTFSDFFS